ncbi:MAG: hypothetical protein IMZ50_16510 [Candidatus Atribacteria bacterium]|nr:hypothetical protein [Candidatus Atribacteria bacterium]
MIGLAITGICVFVFVFLLVMSISVIVGSIAGVILGIRDVVKENRKAKAENDQKGG